MHYIENIKLSDFVYILDNYRVMLFGAGKMAGRTLDMLEEFYPQYAIDNILCILDNDPSKWGSSFKYKDNIIPIRAVDDIDSDIIGDIAIIVTTIYCDEILKQLGADEKFVKTHVICSRDMPYLKILDDFYVPPNIKITDKPLIPKVIHYCWFGGKTIPENCKEWMHTWKKYCPDYEIVEWNEENYDYKKNEYMYEAYKAKKWAFVSDYARLDVVYNHGGIYLDTDVELIKNIDELLYQNAFMGMQFDLSISTGGGFGAVKNHFNIKQNLLEYENRTFLSPSGIYDLTPCPDIITPMMEMRGYKRENKYQIVDDVAIFPAPVLGGFLLDKLVVNENVYTIHHYVASWFSAERMEAEKRIRVKRNESLKKYRNVFCAQ